MFLNKFGIDGFNGSVICSEIEHGENQMIAFVNGICYKLFYCMLDLDTSEIYTCCKNIATNTISKCLTTKIPMKLERPKSFIYWDIHNFELKYEKYSILVNAYSSLGWPVIQIVGDKVLSMESSKDGKGKNVTMSVLVQTKSKKIYNGFKEGKLENIQGYIFETDGYQYYYHDTENQIRDYCRSFTPQFMKKLRNKKYELKTIDDKIIILAGNRIYFSSSLGYLYYLDKSRISL